MIEWLIIIDALLLDDWLISSVAWALIDHWVIIDWLIEQISLNWGRFRIKWTRVQNLDWECQELVYNTRGLGVVCTVKRKNAHCHRKHIYSQWIISSDQHTHGFFFPHNPGFFPNTITFFFTHSRFFCNTTPTQQKGGYKVHDYEDGGNLWLRKAYGLEFGKWDFEHVVPKVSEWVSMFSMFVVPTVSQHVCCRESEWACLLCRRWVRCLLWRRLAWLPTNPPTQVGGLVDWLIGWLVDWLIGWLVVGWWVGGLYTYVSGRSVSAGCWLLEYTQWMTMGWVWCVIDWLIDCLSFYFRQTWCTPSFEEIDCFMLLCTYVCGVHSRFPTAITDPHWLILSLRQWGSVDWMFSGYSIECLF